MELDPILALRRMTDETDKDSTYSDAEISARLDSSASNYAAARDIWMEKLAAASSLANISEGGSSRSMSQVYDHAKDMWTTFSTLADSAAAGGATNSPVLRKITRV